MNHYKACKGLCYFFRDMEKVLREDRERLRRMQKSQPRFTSEQRRELIEQHPWMRRGGLPKAINVKVCEHGRAYVMSST